MQRAMVLSDKVGNEQQQIQTLFGLQTLYVVQARHEKVVHTYAQLEQLFMQTQGTPPPPFASIYLAGAKLSMGQFAEARALFEKVVAVRDVRHIRDLQESQGIYLVHGLPGRRTPCVSGLSTLAPEMLRRDSVCARVCSRSIGAGHNYLALLQEWRICPDIFWAPTLKRRARSSVSTMPYYHAWADILLSLRRQTSSPMRQPGGGGATRFALL
jgi:hypothetical protein